MIKSFYEEVSGSLEAVKALVPLLNAAIDEVTAAIVAVDRFLESNHVGLPAEVRLSTKPIVDHPPCEPGDASEESRFRYLDCTAVAYERYQGKFHLVFKTWREDADRGAVVSQAHVTPLASASRDAKLAAVEYLPKILDQIVVAAKSKIDLVEQHKTFFTSVTAAVKAV